jgi:alkanesulfonate monooxygenase SsuD/methylene tetrahydromethanopterin reductase-like flavin-dependent oxidoreductase (luciferase family)
MKATDKIETIQVGVTLYLQNAVDWTRYLASEKGDHEPLDPEIDRRRWTEELESALEIEDLGFDSIWDVEHHIAPYTMTPNPVNLLSYIAGATKKIDVGTMVIVLPWHHPLRVAEDITMLQYFLGKDRTARIGFGRGAAVREFRQLGFEMSESRGRFDEAVSVIKLALTEERFSFHGEHFNMDDVTMRPRPLDGQALIDNFCFAWGTPASASVGAAHGLKPMIIPQKPFMDYHQDLEEFQKVRDGLGMPPVNPRMHFNVFCAETEEEAERGAREYIPQYTASALNNYDLQGNHFKDIKGYEYYAQRAQAMEDAGVEIDPVKGMSEMYIANHIWGTPDQCIQKMKTIADAFHPEEFMLVCRYGEMTKEVADKSTKLFAKEVLPAIQEMKVGEPITYAEKVSA